jgi:hypothetical protein
MAPTAAITRKRLSRHLVRLSLSHFLFFLSLSCHSVGGPSDRQTERRRESVAVCVVVWNKETRERERKKTRKKKVLLLVW